MSKDDMWGDFKDKVPGEETEGIEEVPERVIELWEIRAFFRRVFRFTFRFLVGSLFVMWASYLLASQYEALSPGLGFGDSISLFLAISLITLVISVINDRDRD
jgi:hypothetical protein